MVLHCVFRDMDVFFGTPIVGDPALGVGPLAVKRGKNNGGGVAGFVFVRVIPIGWRRRLEVLGHVLAVLIWVQVVSFFVKVGKRSRLAFVLLGVWHLGMGMVLARDEGMDGVGLFKGGVLI